MRFLLALSTSLLCLAAGYSAQDAQKQFDLAMGYLTDSRLPGITKRDIEVMVEEANKTLKLKFGVQNLNFIYQGALPVEQFFTNFLDRADPHFKALDRGRLKLFQTNDFTPFKDDIRDFLGQWEARTIAGFIPNHKGPLQSYDEILPVLMGIYFDKVHMLEGIKLKDGSDLLRRKNNDFQSYINWQAAMYRQDQFDIIICNTFIVYDAMVAPYPHGVTRLAQVGGSSFASPKRKTFNGVVAMVTLFEMLTDIPYFTSTRTNQSLDRDLRSRAIGAFVLAHEVGHMIFLIPDVYDHDPGCLMNSSHEKLDCLQGYEEMKKYPKPCAKCAPYVDAVQHHFSGDALAANGKWREAIAEYKLCIRMTPEWLDMNPPSYRSVLEFKIASSYVQLNDRLMAKAYCQLALEDNPENDAVKALSAKLEK